MFGGDKVGVVFVIGWKPVIVPQGCFAGMEGLISPAFGSAAGDPFVDDQLDGFANRKLQILGDAVGQFVRLFFKPIVQDGVRFTTGAQRIVREECGEVVEGVFFFAAKGVVEVETEIAALGKSVAVKQQDLATSEKQDPARGFILGEQSPNAPRPIASTKFVIGLSLQLVLGRFHLQRIFRWHAILEATVRQQEVRFTDNQPRLVITVDSGQTRNERFATFDRMIQRFDLRVTKGIKQVRVP